MTEQEQQLIQAILRIDHVIRLRYYSFYRRDNMLSSAPEVAMALVFGINQPVDNRLRKMAEYVKQLSSHHPELQGMAFVDLRDRYGMEITDNLIRYLAYTIKGTTDNEYGNHPIDFTARILALLYFHPDNEQEFINVETIGGFDPLNAKKRFSFLLDGCSINSVGRPQLNSWFNQFPENHEHAISFFLHLIGECPDDIAIHESLRVRNITTLSIVVFRLMSIPSLDKMTALTYLDCSCNQLTSLDVSGCTALETLYCNENDLTSLDVSGCTALTYLECEENQLTSLDVSQNTALTELICGNNQLSQEQKERIKAQFPFASFIVES